jgi:hypothetical protein
MYKKIIGGITVIAIAAVAAWNVSLNRNEMSISGVALGNVEAVASCEISRGNNTVFECRGEDGLCTDTRFGYTLTCSGVRVGN